VAFGSGWLGTPDDLPAYLAGLALAAGSSIVGFRLLGRANRLSAHAFVSLLLGLFLGRVTLVGAFGLALNLAAPAHLASGLLSLVGFHFIFAVSEIVLLARTRTTAPSQGPETRAIGAA
jgi:hypothetical protein